MGTLKHPRRKQIYLLSPYTHTDPDIRQDRHDKACFAAAVLIRAGYNVFSPIAHSHTISQHAGNDCDSRFWTELDLSFLEAWADEARVLMLDGWLGSDGIKTEFAAAMKAGIETGFMTWDQVMEMAADMGMEIVNG